MPEIMTIEILDKNGKTVTTFTLPVGFNIRIGYQSTEVKQSVTPSKEEKHKRKWHKLSISDKELYEEYNSTHCTYATLAEKYGVSPSCIGNAMKRYREALLHQADEKSPVKEDLPKAESLPSDDHGFHEFLEEYLEANKEEIIEEYESGINSSIIANRLHLNKKQIQDALKAWGIELRDERTTNVVRAEKLSNSQKDGIDLLLARGFSTAEVAEQLSVKETQVIRYAKKNRIAYAVS